VGHIGEVEAWSVVSDGQNQMVGRISDLVGDRRGAGVQGVGGEQGACGNAAVPGTSRHGLGINVDLMTGAQRAWVDAHGAAWGWSKRWSDAPWEWWHVTCRPDLAKARPSARPVLHYRVKGPSVQKLQRLLRARGFKSVPGKGHKGYGYFGAATLSAVKRFQHAHGLKPDGVVGDATWRRLVKA
jgi:hypothetical protein